MSSATPTLGSSGLVDAEGRLVEAEPRLAALNARAGGELGTAVALAGVASLAGLALRLGISVSRTLLVADGEDDRELSVRAEPGPGGSVRLTVTGWRDQLAWEPAIGSDDGSDDAAMDPAGWQWETDAGLRLTALSTGAAAPDAASLVGQPLTRLFALDEEEDGSLPILDAVAAGRGFAGQRAVLRPTGARAWLRGRARLDGTGRFAGLAGTVRWESGATNIPPPAMTTPEPAGAQDAFSRRLDRALRMPLGRIIANADSIHARTEGELTGDYAGYAADIAAAGRHLLGLVDDLVDLQAIEGPDFAVRSEPLDLADVARRAAGLLNVRAADRQVTIDRPAPGDALPATGEFRRALQVLVNLIGNAVRYSPENATVWVRLERDGEVAAVIVADQGRGIAADDQARIFEKFERVDPGEVGGSGLGLYIARRLARAMGGDIVVDSAPGQGARFVFTLPARD